MAKFKSGDEVYVSFPRDEMYARSKPTQCPGYSVTHGLKHPGYIVSPGTVLEVYKEGRYYFLKIRVALDYTDRSTVYRQPDVFSTPEEAEEKVAGDNSTAIRILVRHTKGATVARDNPTGDPGLQSSRSGKGSETSRPGEGSRTDPSGEVRS